MMFVKNYIKVFDTSKEIDDPAWENLANIYPAQRSLVVNFTDDMKKLQEVFGVVDMSLNQEVHEHIAQSLAYHPRWPLNWGKNNTEIHRDLREIIAFSQVQNGKYYLRFNFESGISDDAWLTIKNLTIIALGHFVVSPMMEISYGVE